MDIHEWMAWKKITVADISMKTKASNDTIRKWLHGRTPAQHFRDILFDWSKGQLVWDVDKVFKDDPRTVTNRNGGRDVKKTR